MRVLTIIEFLEARITEDEELARAASVGMHGKHEDAWDWGGYVLGADRDSTPKQDEFIIAWWPKRALAECAAKRVIVSLFDPEDAKEDSDRDLSFYAGGVDDCIRALAAVYKDHPDYDPAWQ